MAQPQPRHHLLGWLSHDEDAAPLASSQLPVAAFPATYSSPQNVLPTGQGNAAGCETAAKAPKKPCFLKVWIHDLKNGHGSDVSDCGHGGALCQCSRKRGRLRFRRQGPEEALLLESLDSRPEEWPWARRKRLRPWRRVRQCSSKRGGLRDRGQGPQETLLLESLDSRLEERPWLRVRKLPERRWLVLPKLQVLHRRNARRGLRTRRHHVATGRVGTDRGAALT